MLNQYFVNQGLKEVRIEEFIRRKFPDGNYSHMELQRTPLGIKIVIYSSTPGRIIGRGGRTINDMTDALRGRFGLENPQLDVKAVPKPYLDAKIVAKQIATALGRGFNVKKIGNTMAKRVMGAGAIGIEIIVSGRVSGGKAMVAKFVDGYLKHSGEQAKTLVDRGFEEIYEIGRSKPGKIGIKVKIMREFQTITGELISSMKDLKPGRMDEARRDDEAAHSPKTTEDGGTDERVREAAVHGATKCAAHDGDAKSSRKPKTSTGKAAKKRTSTAGTKRTGKKSAAVRSAATTTKKEVRENLK